MKRRVSRKVFFLIGMMLAVNMAGCFIKGELGAFLTASWDSVLLAVMCVLAYAGLERRWARVFAWLLFAVTVCSLVGVNVLLTLCAVRGGLEEDHARIGAFLQTHCSLLIWVGAASALAGATGLLARFNGFRRLCSVLTGEAKWTSVRVLALAVVISFTLIGFVPLIKLGAPPYLLWLKNSPDPMKFILGDRDAAGMMRDDIYDLSWTLLTAALAVGYGVTRNRREVLDRLGLLPVTGKQIGTAILLTGFYLGVSYLADKGIDALWLLCHWPATDQKSVDLLFSPYVSFSGAVVIGVTAGIGEEVVVRGILQPRLGILFSNLFFTSLHAYQYGWDSLLSVFLGGLALGFIRKKTSTTVSAIVHGGYDFVLVLMALLPSHLSASDPHRAAPIEYPGMTVRVDTNGVQSVGYRFNGDCAKPAPWLAQWIWADAQPSPLAAMFRKTVTLREKPQAVKAWLTADTKYFLYVNGRLVARGPVDIGRDYAGGSTRHWFYDCRDLTPYFVEGTNVVAAVVFQQWPIRFAVSHGQPGFLFEAEITDASGKKTMVASDASWRSLPAGQFLNDTNCDLTKEPAGWRRPEEQLFHGDELKLDGRYSKEIRFDYLGVCIPLASNVYVRIDPPVTNTASYEEVLLRELGIGRHNIILTDPAESGRQTLLQFRDGKECHFIWVKSDMDKRIEKARFEHEKYHAAVTVPEARRILSEKLSQMGFHLNLADYDEELGATLVEMVTLNREGVALKDIGGSELVVKAVRLLRDEKPVASDASWQSLCDLTKEPAGWRLPGFDDTKWGASQVVTNVWEPLVASEIPPLMEANYPARHVEGLPQNGIFTNDGHFKVVFDRVLSAYPTLTVEGGAGATVKIQAHRNYSFKLRGGRETLEFPFMDEIAPAYTVELKNVTAPLKIESADAIFTSQPVEYRGEFTCSDEQLNRIWNASRWAVQINLQTHHLDSPNHQEPIGDPGDYLIESMVNHYAFAQPWLTRQDVRKFAWLLKDENYHNFHTSYSISWLQMLMDYYDYTGDKSLVEEMSPYVHELLDTYTSWRGTNGLISEAPNYMFMDWVTISGFNCHHPPAVIGQGYLTAFYYHGLEMASRVAGLTGDTERVEKYKKLRGEIAAAFNRELWVTDKGLYRDGKPFQTSVKPGRRLPADKDIETFSPHVNLLAVLYDLAPKEKQAAIVEKVLAEKPLNTQPWFMHWVFQAIDHAGLFDQYGTPQMRRWQIVQETQSFREMWNSGDLSHGWCSTPLVQMSQRILGVEPASPGFKTMAIRPHVCDLTWAKGKVPTPHGDVAVSWNWADGKISLDVTIPDGTEADVIFPTETEHIPAGHHHFESAYKRAF